MGKSSASLKKKGSKKSSKAKASSKRKSGKYKSKKVSRHEVSLSSSDYDDSKSMDTSMSSSSEDSHTKRSRSHSRKYVKGRKKVRRRSHSRDSSEDSLYARKRKKMKRKSEHEVRKKPYQKKKKVKREASVSPRGSGSRSCSTCQGGNSGSDDDSQYESFGGRSERKEKDKRKLKRGRSKNEKSSRYRTRSCSPCTPYNGSCAEVAEDKYVGENNSRRLRSVITVTRAAEESDELYRNETNEEIVDDHDYPCRSNDSKDGGTKRESGHHILPSSEEKLRDEDEIGDLSADFNFMEPKTVDRSYDDRSNLQAYSAEASESMKNETNDTSGANLDNDDLESILRQQALENLKRFRGEIQSTAKPSDQKYKNVNQKKQLITDKHEQVQGKSIVNNADIGTKFNKLTPVEETNFSVSRKNLNAYPTNNEMISNMDKDISSSAMHHLACPQGKVTDAGNLSETVTKSNNCRTNNPKLTKQESRHLLHSHSTLKQTPVSRLPQEQLIVAETTKDTGISAHVVSHSSNDNGNDIRGMSSGVPKHSIHSPKFRHNNLNKGKDEVKEQSHFEPKQTSASNKPLSEKFPMSEDDVEKNAVNTTQAAIQSIINSGSDVGESNNSAIPKSCIESSSVENNSGNLQDESNPGSQFEQKKMTVMRGGELVQVSYKVYIPKKAPALSRRQLKR
ncbi:hypothetical protein TanjilG_03669 [Lupinus angustifolius]|uniref:Uncharacterized protein n=1 Tax=Lupinus angustifolius TaxID=3871 RepID=A0A1J7GXG1_LUPAN|nr:PREDICTED: uncharacterized protein LOC109356962 [Lupinus angustifolius]OIW05280.1 hypothetical protein TanjilG_03669 [Lupinus angustifolius]